MIMKMTNQEGTKYYINTNEIKQIFDLNFEMYLDQFYQEEGIQYSVEVLYRDYKDHNYEKVFKGLTFKQSRKLMIRFSRMMTKQGENK